jgi:hypothetical protein
MKVSSSSVCCSIRLIELLSHRRPVDASLDGCSPDVKTDINQEEEDISARQPRDGKMASGSTGLDRLIRLPWLHRFTEHESASVMSGAMSLTAHGWLSSTCTDHSRRA